MAKFSVTILLVVFLIESTLQKRHGFNSELLHVYGDSSAINSPQIITPDFLNSFVQHRFKRDLNVPNNEKSSKPTVNNAKTLAAESTVSASDRNSTGDLQTQVQNNATVQTTNNITTMVRKAYQFHFEINIPTWEPIKFI